MKIIAVITSGIAWFIKNVNMIIGIIGAIGKAIAGVINIFQPSKDSLVDTVERWKEKIQKGLFSLSEKLKKLGEK